ncbi:MAG: hypothetical protein HY232_06350 [Acidobacteria bacterium]|nr:hypothetical protein [Acidobacteriota bacterium]
MCRLVHHLNFMGKYVIFDLPEFSLLQYYFLKSYGFAVYKNLDEFDRNPYGILCCSSQEIFAPWNLCFYWQNIFWSCRSALY